MLNNKGVSTLQEFSNNQKEIEKYLEEQEEFFNKLIDDFKNERLKPGISRESFVCIYGEPICSREAVTLPAKEILLYRHPTKYFSSDKIYLYFDGYEKLIRWEYKPHK